MVKHLLPYLEQIVSNRYAEPFVGGGSVALAMAERFPSVLLAINDADQDVACFWRVICGPPPLFDKLCSLLEESRAPTDDPKHRFVFWEDVRATEPKDDAARAFRFVFLNKTTFGGQVDASPIGGWQQNGWKGSRDRTVMCQYSVDNIVAQAKEARQLLAGRTTVYNLDFRDFLDAVEAQSLYVDPPYFPGQKNKLYRVMMTVADHECLAERLHDYPQPWVLSYDDCPEVRNLYSWAACAELSAHYSSAPAKTNWKHQIELIITPTPIDIMPEPTPRTQRKTRFVPTPEPEATPEPGAPPEPESAPEAEPPTSEEAHTSPAGAVLPPVRVIVHRRRRAQAEDVAKSLIAPAYVAWMAIEDGCLVASTFSSTEDEAQGKAEPGASIRQFKLTIVPK